MDEPLIPDYCREVEAYLCRKNDGHLIRITGPSFDIVSRWASTGIPLKVAFSGIDRYFERYYRNGSRRRPVRIDFCDADVLDAFDQWRRALGLTRSVPESETAASANGGEAARPRRGPSLPEHLERVLTKLSSLRAAGVLTQAADGLLDRVSAELDAVRAAGGGVRGAARRDTVARLAELDAQLIRLATDLSPSGLLETIRRDAADQLAAYRSAMSDAAFAGAVERAVAHGIRERLGLPTIAYA